MKRNLEKYIHEYDQYSEFEQGGLKTLTASELQKIVELSETDGRRDVYSSMINSLKIGYVMGRKAEKRIQRAQSKQV